MKFLDLLSVLGNGTKIKILCNNMVDLSEYRIIKMNEYSEFFDKEVEHIEINEGRIEVWVNTSR